MSERQLSDQIRELAQQIADGEISSMAMLFDLSSRRLVRFAITITRHQQDAEDAVQVALLGVASRPRLLVSAVTPWHYLLKMVRNESLLALRKKKRWIVGTGLQDILSCDDSCSIQQEDLNRSVWMALRTLPADQRQVVVLKIWEEMTFQEIADILECSLQTVASRYRYAIQKLTPKLQGYYKESHQDA